MSSVFCTQCLRITVRGPKKKSIKFLFYPFSIKIRQNNRKKIRQRILLHQLNIVNHAPYAGRGGEGGNGQKKKVKAGMEKEMILENEGKMSGVLEC